jgi:hypothetical protein
VLVALPPFCLLAGYGFRRFEEFISRWTDKSTVFVLILIFIVFSAFAPRVRRVGQEAWACRADHQYAKAMLEFLPRHSVVFTHNPHMFLFWGKSSAQASILAGYSKEKLEKIREGFPGGIFFHFNFWCNASDPLQQSFCRIILEKFKYSEVVRFDEWDYTYALFRIH